MRGKVVLCFGDSYGASDIVKAAGGVGLIFANNLSYYISPCKDLPCIEVDNSVGAQLLSYIRSSRLAERKNPFISIVASFAQS